MIFVVVSKPPKQAVAATTKAIPARLLEDRFRDTLDFGEMEGKGERKKGLVNDVTH